MKKIGIPLSIGFIKRRPVLETTLYLNPIGTDANFFQLAGEKAGLKLPNALNCSFPNQKKLIMLSNSQRNNDYLKGRLLNATWLMALFSYKAMHEGLN